MTDIQKILMTRKEHIKRNPLFLDFYTISCLFLLKNTNSIIRLNLLLNLISDKLKLNQSSKIGKFTEKIFFLTGYGRSGTKFLASLLNKVPNVHAEHEPFSIEKVVVVHSFHGTLNLGNYLKLKHYQITSLFKPGTKVYGEVNSYLRHHIVEIGEFFNAKIGYVLRDGRDIVTSMMNRPVYSRYIDPLRPSPKKGDAFYREFCKMSRFEKCCWAWAEETKRALAKIREKAPYCKFFRFEEFTCDINALYEICDYLELHEAKDYIKEEDLRKRINISPSYTFPKHKEWTRTLKDQFNRIAGEINVSIGYDLA